MPERWRPMTERRFPIGLLALLAVGAALAAGKIGPEFQVNTYTPGDQKYPAVAMSPDGSFVVVWESGLHPLDLSGKAIIGRRFDSAGNPLADEFLVNSLTTGDQHWPALAVWSSQDQA
jgi:hypothetical protein